MSSNWPLVVIVLYPQTELKLTEAGNACLLQYASQSIQCRAEIISCFCFTSFCPPSEALSGDKLVINFDLVYLPK